MSDEKNAAPPNPPTDPGAALELSLPGWQQWLNAFCENWLFAFIIAMGIRHFCVEAFRIPTASMEPMLYGDPAFSKADHVVVDKFFFRFTGPSRWDVTVFQFPQPEIEPLPGERTDARTAISADGGRLDRIMMRPLMYRNFVKRAVVLPGDKFYIAGGDIYLEQPDGTYAVSRKPESVQEELWQEVYRFGLQREYQPWTPSGGAQVSTDDGTLRVTLPTGGAATLFDQQFRNLYMKPGLFRVSPRNSGSSSDVLIELSMTKPFFTYAPTGRTGVAWDLSSWNVSRMTTADLDSNSYGTLLNKTMDEWVGDVRFTGTIASLSGTTSLELSQGKAHKYTVQFNEKGWRILADNAVRGEGGDSCVGKEFKFGHLDNQIFFMIDGVEKVRIDVPPSDPELYRLGARWIGNGTVALSALSMQRDVHYTKGNDGSFLRNDTQYYLKTQRESEFAKSGSYGDSYNRDLAVKLFNDLKTVRAQMLGKPVDQLTPEEAAGAIGYSPETAIKVPEGAYLMLGDNSPQSWDSRCWGYVAAENLRGRVLAVVLPFSRWRVVR